MKRRWIVPAGTEGNVEIMIDRDGGLALHVIDARCTYTGHVGPIAITEDDRLELIEALKSAGRSRAGAKREPRPEGTRLVDVKQIAS